MSRGLGGGGLGETINLNQFDLDLHCPIGWSNS